MKLIGPEKRCGATGREIYASKAEARADLKSRASYHRNLGHQGIYRCPFADHYHMTSQPHGRRKRSW